MTPFFQSPELITHLQSVAKSWISTPFMPNACIKGHGVSCQKLAGAIYAESGFLPGFAAPEGPMDWGHANTRSLLAEFMDRHPSFERVERKGFYPLEAIPGDMLGFKIGGCIQHCGIMTTGSGDFVHCYRAEGVLFSFLREPSYAQRLERIWRPITRTTVAVNVSSRQTEPKS
jgi:hypothetical protein